MKGLYLILALLCVRFVAAQPTITSFSPTSGPVGATVTITGTGFSTTVANNIVFFGAVRATVATATATQLTMPVPAGATYAPITVTVNGLTRQSLTPFNPTFSSNGVIDEATFAPKVDLPASTTVAFLAAGDLDGDGRADLVSANFSSGVNTISIFRNTSTTGNVSFASKFDMATGNSPNKVVLADLDGDGKLDICVTHNLFNFIRVWRNQSSSGTLNAGSFATPQDFAKADGGYGLAAVDVDGDGKLDLVATNQISQTISVLRNLSTVGSLSFGTKVDFAAGNINLYDISTGDIDGDGRADLAVSAYAANVVSVYRNTSSTGTVSLATKVDFTATRPIGIQITDIDSDAKPDLIVTNYDAVNTVSIYKNQAGTGAITSGSFQTPVAFSVASLPQYTALGDFNGDGRVDLAASSLGADAVSVLRNTGTDNVINSNSFASRVNFAANNEPLEIVAADFDNDGRMDAAVTNYDNGGSNVSISVFRNTSSPPAPTITSFTPAFGPVGTTVTITGTNFSTTPANNIVYFGAVRAAVSAATATQLTVTVPVGAVQSPITVSVNNLVAYSPRQFRPTFTGSGILDAASFSARVDLPVSANLQRMTAGDIDGDGKVDLISSHATSSLISVFRNTATAGTLTTGSFATKVDFATSTPPFGVEVADIDGDGKLDIVAANYEPGGRHISVFRNVSTAGVINTSSLATRIDLGPATNAPYFVSIADMDGDGKGDIVFDIDSSIGILRNISTPGNIAFSSPFYLTTSLLPNRPVLEDLDGDGRRDIVFVHYNATVMSIYRNIGMVGTLSAASFATRVDYSIPQFCYDLRASDLDNDGKPDLVVSFNNNSTSNLIYVFKNQSSVGVINASSFAAGVAFITLTGPSDLWLADVTGDDKVDIISTNYQNASISVLRNVTSTGVINSSSFDSRVDLMVSASNPSASRGLVVADFDGDGRPDLATPNINSNALSLFRNQTSSPPPTISSFTPTSGAIGSTVTITGTNFSTTAANNIVHFGAVRATISAATATQLTVTVPTGATHQPISVTTNNLTAYSALPFRVTYSTGIAIDASSFTARTDFSTPTAPYNLAAADLDSDGKLDLISANSSGSISLLRNTSTIGALSTGSFAAKVDFAAPFSGSGPVEAVVEDFDGDGKLDIATPNYGSSASFSVFRNTHNSGSFTSASLATRQDFATQTGTFDLASADIDLDGKPDIAVVSDGLNLISVYRNISIPGSISFAPKVDFAIGSGTQTSGVELADIDGDGRPELLAVNFLTSTLSVLRNVSTPGAINNSSFSAKVDFSTGTNPYRVAVADFDNDGKVDVVVSNHTAGTISVFRNTATSGITASSLAAKQDFTSNAGIINLSVADFDGDGRVDVITGHALTTTVSVFRNTSTSAISFSPRVNYTFSNGALGVFGADLDGDTRFDMGVSNYDAASVSIARNVIVNSEPGAQPTALVFSNVQGTSLTVSFTAATGSPTGYLVLRRVGASPTDVPADGTVYSVGSVIGSSTVVAVGVALTVNQTGLLPGTEYFYDVFAYNGSGILINYRTTTPLEGSRFTLAAEPTAQPTSLTFSDVSDNSMTVAFTAATGAPTGYVVLRRTGAAVADVPVDGTDYTVGQTLGTSTVVALGATVSITQASLAANTVYHYAVFAFNGTGGGRNYLTTTPLTGSNSTLAAAPTAQPTALSFSNVTTNGLRLTFTAATGSPTGYLILRRIGSAPTETPVDGVVYTVGNALGTSTVVGVGTATLLDDTGLPQGTEIFYTVFSFNGSGVATNYNITSAPAGSRFTAVSEPTAQATAFQVSGRTAGSFTIAYTAATGAPTGYVVLERDGALPTAVPVDGITYAVDATVGDSRVAFVGSGVTFDRVGLPVAATRGYAIFSFNGTSGATNYLTTNPLTGLASTLDVEPTAAPTGLTFGTRTTTTFSVSFSAATPAPTGYLVLRKADTAPTEIPLDGTDYSVGDLLGAATVVGVGTSLTLNESALLPGTTYYYAVFAYNNSGVFRNYLTSISLAGSASTLATEPTAQPTNIVFSNRQANSVLVSFTAAAGGTTGYLALRKEGVAPTEVPVDGVSYSTGNSLGTARVAYVGSDVSFTDSGLDAATRYFYDIFAFNGTGNGVNYLATGPLERDVFTLATEPSSQPEIQFSVLSATGFTVALVPPTNPPAGNLVLRKEGSAPVELPDDGVTYTVGADLGTARIVSAGSATTIPQSGLTPSTTYHFAVYSFNGSGAQINYRQTNPQRAQQATISNDNSPPQISHNPAANAPVNTALQISATVTDPQSAVTSVTLGWRPATAATTTFSEVPMTRQTGDNWTAEIPATAMTDLGVVYRIVAVSSGGTTPEVPYRTAVNFGASGLLVPAAAIGFGREETNYRMIAVPLNLPNKSVTAVFGSVFGDYVDTKWVMYRYSGARPANDRFIKLNATSELEPGAGYWILVASGPAGVPLANGSTVSTATPFRISLTPGWNQIGNPFPFAINWQDVLAENSAQASNLSSKPRKYTGDKDDSKDIVNVFEGFYIQNKGTAAIDISIPFKKATGGRVKDVRSSFGSDEWELDLVLENDHQRFKYGGVGMNMQARKGVDIRDDAALPLFADYLDYYSVVDGEKISKDIVPVTPEYVWSFTTRSYRPNEFHWLSWDNSDFGSNDRELWLLNEATGRVTDMRAVNRVNLGTGDAIRFKVLYGDRRFVESRSLPDEPTLFVTPNPILTAGEVEFTLPTDSEVIVDCVDMQGRTAFVIFNGVKQRGRHKVPLHLPTETTASGMYLIRLQTNKGLVTEKVLKN